MVSGCFMLLVFSLLVAVPEISELIFYTFPERFGDGDTSQAALDLDEVYFRVRGTEIFYLFSGQLGGRNRITIWKYEI